MVLQRWQTVLLFFAIALMVLFLATPLGYTAEGASVYATVNTVYFILNLVIAVLLFVDIFLYRNLKVQIKWTAILLVLEAVAAGIGFGIVYGVNDFTSSILGAPLLVVALVLTWFARRLMIKDKKLLDSVNHIR